MHAQQPTYMQNLTDPHYERFGWVHTCQHMQRCFGDPAIKHASMLAGVRITISCACQDDVKAEILSVIKLSLKASLHLHHPGMHRRWRSLHLQAFASKQCSPAYKLHDDADLHARLGSALLAYCSSDSYSLFYYAYQHMQWQVPFGFVVDCAKVQDVHKLSAYALDI